MANWIIVIDDDAATLKLAGHLLSKAGYRVTALKSGRLALDYVRKNGVPDLFLLDLNMPDLDGFQTLELLRKEMAPGQDIPVIFLTAENRVEQEARGLESGAMDYIRKPFDPDVLINRVRRILDVQTQMNRLAVSAEKDPLTGMLNKAASEALMTRLCSREKGLLCVLDLDAFKSVNDIFGHDTGDRILVMFSQILSAGLEHPDECGRIGGDEFIVFLRNRKRSEDLEEFARKINEDYIAGARAILGDRLNSAIGVSIRPRSMEGSYMPCFTVGSGMAQILSDVMDIPLYTFSHQEGHIAAALFSSGRLDLMNGRFIAFHVSGGTTEALLVNGSGTGFSEELIASSLDLKAGQAIDRTAVMLGLPFPGGIHLEKLALQCSDTIKYKPTMKGCDCCLSGIENKCGKLLNEGASKEYIAKFCLTAVMNSIIGMTDAILEAYGELPMIYAGGVMSNGIMKREISARYAGANFAAPDFSCDNAAGVAILAAAGIS